MFNQKIDCLAASVGGALGPVNIIETGDTEKDVDSVDYHYVDQEFDEEFYENLASGKFWHIYKSTFFYNITMCPLRNPL